MANHCWNYAVFHDNPEGAKKLHKKLLHLRDLQLKEEYTDNGEEIPSYKDCESLSLYALLYPKLFKQKWKEEDDVYEKFGSRWFEFTWELCDDGSITLQGDSAWSPVIALFKKICKHYKMSAYGNYEESGCDIAGEFQMDQNGIITHNEMTYWEYQAENNPNYFWEQRIEWIEEGHFETLEAIFEEFARYNWRLTAVTKQELEEEFNKHKESLKNEN